MASPHLNAYRPGGASAGRPISRAEERASAETPSTGEPRDEGYTTGLDRFGLARSALSSHDSPPDGTVMEYRQMAGSECLLARGRASTCQSRRAQSTTPRPGRLVHGTLHATQQTNSKGPSEQASHGGWLWRRGVRGVARKGGDGGIGRRAKGLNADEAVWQRTPFPIELYARMDLCLGHKRLDIRRPPTRNALDELLEMFRNEPPGPRDKSGAARGHAAAAGPGFSGQTCACHACQLFHLLEKMAHGSAEVPDVLHCALCGHGT